MRSDYHHFSTQTWNIICLQKDSFFPYCQIGSLDRCFTWSTWILKIREPSFWVPLLISQRISSTKINRNLCVLVRVTWWGVCSLQVKLCTGLINSPRDLIPWSISCLDWHPPKKSSMTKASLNHAKTGICENAINLRLCLIFMCSHSLAHWTKEQ